MICFIGILNWLSIVDIKKQEIPDRCHIIAIVIRIFYYFMFEGYEFGSFWYWIASGFSVAFPVLCLTVMMEKVWKKETLGGGDIKLLFVTGLYLGWENNLIMLFIACMIGIVIGLYKSNQMVASEKVFPFGPVISASTIACLFFYEDIQNWHLFCS